MTQEDARVSSPQEQRMLELREALIFVMAANHPARLPDSVDHGDRTYPCPCPIHEKARRAIAESWVR